MNTTTTPAKTAIEATRARIAKEQAKLAELEAQAEARSKLGERYLAGESIESLADSMNVTTEAARNALISIGAISVRKRKLDQADVAIAITALRSGETVAACAERLNFAEAAVRRIAREIGLSQRTPQRTPKQMEELVKLEEQVRQLYGAGFAALGEALRKHRKSLGEPMPSSEQVAEEEAAVAEMTVTGDLGDAPEHDVAEAEPTPIPAAVGAPPVLSPEDQAKMAEPDDAPWA